MDKPALGIVSPLPPRPSGVADYALEQARRLAHEWSLVFLVGDDQPDPAKFLPPGASVERWSRWAARHERGSMKLLHHIGNNPQHGYVLDALKTHGGVVLLHELGLHNLMAWTTLARGDETGYERLLRAEVGDLAPPLARAGARGIRSAFQYALTPLFETVVEAADGVIVHSDSAARELQRRGVTKPLAVVPHFFAPPVNVGNARAARGIGPSDLVFGSLGFITDAKLTFRLIEALGRLREMLPPFRYLLVGEAGDDGGLRAALMRAGIADRATITGYVGDAEFWAHLAACDIVFSLRYPSGGETSGTLVRALGLGKAAIVYDYGPFAEFPDDALAKIPLDTENLAALDEAVLALAHDPARRAAIAEAAREDSSIQRDPTACAQKVSDFIKCTAPSAA